MSDSDKDSFPVIVEFANGLEMLFSNQKKHEIRVPKKDGAESPPNVSWLVDHLCDKVMKDSRKELFILHDAVRPGILVLINDADWELEGESSYELQKGDNIMFVSTLHGG